MKIVTTTSVFPYDFPPENALIRLSDVGFRYLDLAMDYCAENASCPFGSEAWESWAESLRTLAEDRGVYYTHSHAWGDAASRHALTYRCLDVCRVLGIKYTVIHPIYKRTDGSFIESDDEFVSVNAPAYRHFLEAAERNGVILLSENLLWGASIRASALSALVEEINSPFFGWCYDTGHANAHALSSKALLDVKRVPLSLHIQDNNGNYRDDHLLPGDGSIDWKEFLDVLIKIGYSGDVVLEAHHQSLEAPDCEREAILTELLKRAEKMHTYLISKK